MNKNSKAFKRIALQRHIYDLNIYNEGMLCDAVTGLCSCGYLHTEEEVLGRIIAGDSSKKKYPRLRIVRPYEEET